jgi:Zn-finger nucleic acid-binding protein
VSVCPTCEKELILVSYEDKELLQCIHCQGFWFKKDLFSEIKRIGFAGLCSNEEADTTSKETSTIEDPGEISCPDCAEPLLAYNYAYSSDIQLHRCTTCKGIWADAQALLEIDQLLINYQESLEEAKAKAIPLMMEVKQQFEQKEKAWKEERQRQKKQGLLGRFFGKKGNRNPKIENVFEDIQEDDDNPT